MSPVAQNGVNGAGGPILSLDCVNPNLKKAEYAVRGAIPIRAGEIEKELAEGKHGLPFTKTVGCNIGNPQLLGQKPLTFVRQVLALCDYPDLMDSPLCGQLFPSDAVARAKGYLAHMPGHSTGAYTESKGALICRQDVAKGIEERDGCPCNPEDLWLTDGASVAVHTLMNTIVCGPEDAILCPIPQYPLYSAAIALHGATLVPYYLDEQKGWAGSLEDLQAALDGVRAAGKRVRALVVINPGNPTGQVLDRENQEEVVAFCQKERLILVADEVYQTNIWTEKKAFHSFKKVLHEMGPRYQDVPLLSMNSTSKGFFGECGRRGGYFELVNFPDDVKAQIYKLSSINLCPNTSGQIAIAVIMNPPRPGEPSYELWVKERDAIMESMKRRAKLVVDTFNKLEGCSCTDVEGAMYAFPRLTLPPAALAAAEKAGKPADFQYCWGLLEETGIITVPGSGFGQQPGTLHLRTTILPPESDMKEVSEKVTAYHNKYLAQFK